MTSGITRNGIRRTVNSGRTQHANGVQTQTQSERWTHRRRDEQLVQNNSEDITWQYLRKYTEKDNKFYFDLFKNVV